MTRQAPRNGLLRLLRDCELIAAYDGYASVPAFHPSDRIGTSGKPRTERPDLSRSQTERVAIGGQLRAKLDALHVKGRAETHRLIERWAGRSVRSRVDAESLVSRDRRALEALWVLACLVAHAEDRPVKKFPAHPKCHALPSSGVEKGAAIVEYLVPRARGLLASAHGEKGVPVWRDVPAILAAAFVDSATWAAWHPAPPPKAASAAEREAYKLAVEQGRTGKQRHGSALVRLAVDVWLADDSDVQRRQKAQELTG